MISQWLNQNYYITFRNFLPPWESNPQPPHYECGALPIEATLAYVMGCTPWEWSFRPQIGIGGLGGQGWKATQ